MNRSGVVTAVVWLDCLVAAAKAKREELAGQLDADARAEYAEHGTAPTWRYPDVAKVTSRVSHSSVRIADEAAFMVWVQANHPDAVETLTRVRAGWQTRLLDEVLESGREVPGVVREQGGKFLGVSVSAERDAKRALGMLAEQGLKAAALNAGSVVAPTFAELEAADFEV